jgi:hypothetical protein
MNDLDDTEDNADRDADRDYDEYRDKILEGHPSGCSILNCICGLGTPYSKSRKSVSGGATTGWDGTIRATIKSGF